MAGIYLYATYSAVQFGIYEELLSMRSPRVHHALQPWY